MLRLLKGNDAKVKEKTRQGVRRSRESWFSRIVDVLRSPQLDEGVWDDLEELLISADVGVEPSLSLIERLKSEAQDERWDQPQQIFQSLKRELVSRLETGVRVDARMETESDITPFVILVVGVNGSGKTTSLAKLAYRFKEAGKKVVIGAGDTFRAAAIDQVQILGQRVGVDVISHQPGADSGAVAFDAFQASKARMADVLIIDTAGRLHTKDNLMEELKKIKRVLQRLDPSAPHEVVLVLDATTGHNGLSQARHFTKAVDCTGVFLAKLDGTAKGGIVLAIKNELDLPIVFIGTGEGLEDLAAFDPKEFVEALLEPVPSPHLQT